MKIGFIGLGIMGSRMAANLQKHGYALVLYNRTSAKAKPLLGPCATLAESPATLAAQVDVLFTMLAEPAAVEDAASGNDGFLNHLRPKSLWVDCSSVDPSFSKRMAAEAARREVRFVDAPVTGSAVPASEGKLTFWVGAEPADLETIRPLLLCMGSRVVHMGEHGSGAAMKIVVNLVMGNAMAAFAEGIILGQALGLSQTVLIDALLATPAAAPFLASKRTKIIKGDYEAEFPLRWQQKDLHLASESGYEAGIALPITNVTKEVYRLAMREGHAVEDFSAIYEYLATNHDMARRTKNSPTSGNATSYRPILQ
jgi:glyoxylate/succinic semialdehyde reductase